VPEPDWRHAREKGAHEKAKQLRREKAAGCNTLTEDQIRKKAQRDSLRHTHEAMRRAEDK
jgi:hypothetical protein